MNAKNILFFISLLLSSCSYVLKNIDKSTEILTLKADENNIKKNYCDEKRFTTNLISENKKNQDTFKSFIKNVEKKYKFKFVDKIVLWSFVQMIVNPLESSPTSRMQIMLKYNGKDYYFNYYDKLNGGMPYLYALENILKSFNSSYSIRDLVLIFDNFYPNKLYVSKDFQSFLSNNKTLVKSEKFKTFYMKGDETLKENERISKPKLSQLLSIYKSNSFYKNNLAMSDYLFKFNSSPKVEIFCNYDLGLYKSSIYLISKDIFNSNIFGLSEENNVFMASSTQSRKELGPLKGTMFFVSNHKSRPSASCRFNVKDQDKSTWLFSTNERDPGQHLYHLIEYNVQNVVSINHLNQILKFSRHLFLQNPTRLIFETNKSSKEQLFELLKLNLPIYHANSLGKIWGYYEQKDISTFILDERHGGSLSCVKN